MRQESHCKVSGCRKQVTFLLRKGLGGQRHGLHVKGNLAGLQSVLVQGSLQSHHRHRQTCTHIHTHTHTHSEIHQVWELFSGPTLWQIPTPHPILPLTTTPKSFFLLHAVYPRICLHNQNPLQQVSREKDEKHCPINYATKEPKQNAYWQPGLSKDSAHTQNNLQNNPDRHVLLSVLKKDLQRLTALCTILSTIILFFSPFF